MPRRYTSLKAELAHEARAWVRLVVIAIGTVIALGLYSEVRDNRPVFTNMRAQAVTFDGNRLMADLYADKLRACTFVSGSANGFVIGKDGERQWIPLMDEAGNIGGRPSIPPGSDRLMGRYTFSLAHVPDASFVSFTFAHDCGRAVIYGQWPLIPVPEVLANGDEDNGV